MRKVLTTILVTLLVLLLHGAAFAGENIQFATQSSDVFASFGSGIGEISGELEAKAYSSTWGLYNQTIKMELQEYDGGWKTIKTWERSDYTSSMTVLGYYPLVPGKYRVKSTHTAGGETKTSYSDIWIVD
ncbi:MAG: hypothetical protein H0Z35_10620 [Thermoanaerobacteraceae bacterium]|nr:hypothetical protein [Thermoanaerobacteraceae bacterium]